VEKTGGILKNLARFAYCNCRLDLSLDCRGFLSSNRSTVALDEAEERKPAHQSQTDESGGGELLNANLCRIADGDAPADAEVPDAVSKVVARGQNAQCVNHHKNRLRSEHFVPGVELDQLGIVLEILLTRRRGDVIAEEEEDEDARPSLGGIHQVLRPLVLCREVVLLTPIYNEQAIDRVEEKRNPDSENFESEKHVLRNPLKEVDDPVELLPTTQRERVQRKVLDHVVADRDDSGERVNLVKDVVLSIQRDCHKLSQITSRKFYGSAFAIVHRPFMSLNQSTY